MNATDRLEQLLNHEADLAAELLAAMEAKQRAIIDFSVEELLAALRQEELLLKPLERIEGERIALIEAFASGNSGNAEAAHASPTLARVVDAMPGEDGERIRTAGTRLERCAERVRTVNAQNRRLLEHALLFIRSTLAALTEGYSRQLIDQKI